MQTLLSATEELYQVKEVAAALIKALEGQAGTAMKDYRAHLGLLHKACQSVSHCCLLCPS